MKLARRLDRRAALRNRRRSAVKEQIRRGLQAERLEERSLLAGDVFQSAYWNYWSPNDVTADGYVAPNDALAIINNLNAFGAFELPEGLPGAEGETGVRGYVDVDNDGFLSPADALQVINQLNAEGAPGDMPYVEYEVRALQAGTNTPISSIQGGQDFDLAIFVQDLRTDRTDPTGVFSAYMDLLYDKQLSTVRVAEIQSVTLAGTSEFQTITITGGGITRFSFNGVNSTADVNLTAATTAAQIQTNLRTISALNSSNGAVIVTGAAGGPFTVEFRGNLASSNVGLITATVPAAASVAVATEGGGDSFTLTLDGQTTANIPFATGTQAQRDANAVAIQAALNAVLGPNTVQVDLTAVTNTYSIWFTGEYDVNQSKLVATITGGANASVVVKDASDNTPTVAGSFINVDGDKSIKDDVTPTGANRDSFAEAFRTRTVRIGGVVTASPGEFQKDLDARDASNRVDEVGAFAESFNPLGAGTQFEVVRVRMTANLPMGQTMVTQTFTPDIDNVERPAHNTLTYALTTETTFVSPLDIIVTPLDLLITSGPISAANFSVNVDENALNVPINVLANVTDNPGDPVNPVIELVPGSVVKLSGSGTVTQNGNNVTFSTSGELTDTVTFTYTARVQGDTDPNRYSTAIATVNINAFNDAPDITGPAAQNVQEGLANTTINFAANAFTVTDVDVAAGDMTLTLSEASAANSQINLGSTNNLVVTGNGTNTVTATGKIADINAALTGLQYVNTSQVGGNFSLQASISDLGNTGNGGAQTDSVTVAINIASVNDLTTITAPSDVAVAFVDTLTFNGPNAITIADVDSTSITVTLAVSGGVGTLSATGVGGAIVGGTPTNLTITGSPTAVTNTLAGMMLTPPAGNTNVLTGAIAITADDGPGADATANIVVNVIPPNLPFALNDTPQGLVEGSASYTINVLGNDLTNDPANRDPVLVSFTQPMRGGQPVGSVTQDFGPGQSAGNNTNLFDDQLVFNVPGADTNFFTPPGQDITFTYVMNEGPTSGGADATATVTIRIANQADAPVATADNYATTLNTPLTITDPSEGVLQRGTDDSTIDNNYGDPNFATLTVLIDASNPATRTTSQGGSVTINANGTFVYTPQTGDIGNDTFTYQAVSSAGGVSAATTVTIKVASPPIATNDSFTVLEQGNPAVSGNVLTGGPGTADDDTDPTELQTLTAVNLVQSASTADGTVTLAANGDFTYTPEPNQNFNGTVTFTYQAQATDGRLSNVATVTLTVQEVNDPPTAANDTFTAVRQQSGIGIDQPVAVLGNDSIAPDVGETLVVTGIGLTAGGSFSAGPTATAGGGSVRISGGQILYTSPTTIPAGGADSFFYQITDRATGGLTATAKVDVTVVDFVPKTVSGTVYIDSNGNGSLDTGEKPLSGVTVRLTGTSFDNQAVSLTAITDMSGKYIFPQKVNEPGVQDTSFFIRPPNAAGYTITEITPWGLLEGIDSNTTNNPLITNTNLFDSTFVARWAVTDGSGNITGLNFAEGGVDLRPVSEGGPLANSGGFKQEFLASSGANGFVMAVDLSGNLMFSWTLDDPATVSVAWANAKSIHVVLSADLSTLTLTVRDGQNQTFVRTLTQAYSIPGSTARFRVLGTGTAGQYIIRIDASANGPGDGLGMNLLAAAPAAMAGAEGEAPVDQSYAESADAVFAGSAWA